jgi:hypothetical protein
MKGKLVQMTKISKEEEMSHIQNKISDRKLFLHSNQARKKN